MGASPLGEGETRVARIQHVTVCVPSANTLSAAESFYASLGGIPLARPPLLEEDTPGRWLGFGDTQLHLLVGDPLPTSAHFAIELGDRFDAVLAALAGLGAEMRQARDLWGGRRVFVHDPAGNLIELFDRPPESRPLA